ncbi:CAP domain-containing protein [Evansella clarkii]|jgi:uncharacterized protein YkwD|uniref:CAP domain-containing protein n=1 Tax=Evansella clarkii TaxID=79879 RepID=UPI001116E8C4|nr:CAP domain-containing protein [Evansella clarkii]
MRAVIYLLVMITAVYAFFVYINNGSIEEQLDRLDIVLIENHDNENTPGQAQEENGDEPTDHGDEALEPDNNTELALEENNEELREERNNTETESEQVESPESDDNSTDPVKLHNLIGEDSSEVIELYGKPDRVDLSQYGYDWWIYRDTPYLQIGVKEGKIVTVFTNDPEAETELLNVGDTAAIAEEEFTFEDTVSLSGSFTSYQFELTAEDLEMRPLAELDGVWMQLYVDNFERTISAVRYMDQETLLLHRPYSIVYRGELPLPDELSDEEWAEVQEGQARQIFDSTNKIRERHGLTELEWEDDTAYVAYLHSKDMFEDEYFSHTSPNYGELQHRLEAGEVNFWTAAENIAAGYVDGLAAVEGWLNSEGHRVNLLNEEFTHLGVGVYQDFYTQNFLVPR